MHWLTKYANKESTFHNITTFHTTVSYINSSDTLGGTIFISNATKGIWLCEMINVVECALLVCVLY